jgi:hypothetical protein
MATVIKLANLLNKHSDKIEVKEYLETLGEDWKVFVDGELKTSNTLNTRSLGGQQPRNINDDDEDNNQYEVNMEKIMARFTNFNSVMSSDNSNNEEEDETNEE